MRRRIRTRYGRRAGSSHRARHIMSRHTSARVRSTAHRSNSDPSNDLESLRIDYTIGNLRPVPRSVYCDVSSPATLNRYPQITKEIANFMLEERQRRDRTVTLWRNEATSHLDTAKALTDVAITMHDSQATMLSDATRLVEKAANTLKAVSSLEKNYDIVFIYDIDEITMLSKHFIVEFATLFPEIDSFSLLKLSEKLINNVNLTLEEIREEDVISMYYATDDGSDYWRRVGPKYEAFRDLYYELSTEYKEGHPAISQELCDKVGMSSEVHKLRKTVAELQKRVHQRWRRVNKCLHLVHQKSKVSPRRCANVVLSGEGVVFGCVQILLSGNAPMIQMENVYSTSQWDKKEVFRRIEKRFGDTCVFVYIASPQVSDVPEMRQVRHWPVEAADSIKKLYCAQRKCLL